MVKGIIFACEPEIQSLMGSPVGWTNTLDKLGIDFYIMVDTQNEVPNWDDSRRESYRVTNYADALTKLTEVHPECSKIKVEMSQTTDLKDYTHPTDACYIFGPDGGAYPTFTEDGGLKCYADNLWAVECATAVCFDIHAKGAGL